MAWPDGYIWEILFPLSKIRIDVSFIHMQWKRHFTCRIVNGTSKDCDSCPLDSLTCLVYALFHHMDFYHSPLDFLTCFVYGAFHQIDRDHFLLDLGTSYDPFHHVETDLGTSCNPYHHEKETEKLIGSAVESDNNP